MTYAGVPGLVVEHRGHELRLTLDRAERRNAIDDVVLDALVAHVAAAGTDEEVRVIRIDANGPDFCGVGPDHNDRTFCTQTARRRHPAQTAE
ncbi:hypothetical protein MHIB_00090 [Mycolicibacter hiberniae]|uniref:Enoyl-CoA hydratase n=1 Tax=Mycolicibacter hiberniae TaxID=29314 RepID=A0A7I7WYJ3_9MYCO|nr:hypothetical protein MHIB_00090 [Mycolicibacter hiberniae]